MNFIKQRHSRIKQILKAFQLDCFFSMSGHYINYFTDAIDIPGAVLITQKEIFFITDKRFLIEIKKLPRDVTPLIADKPIIAFLGEKSLCNEKKLALDFTSCTLKEAENISMHLKPAGIQDIGPEVTALLNCHDDESIKRTKKAVSIAKSAYLDTIGKLTIGISEIEVADMLSSRMKSLGAPREAFPTIVAFGKNAAKPHAIPTKTKLRSGDVVLIDMGSYYKGVFSDFTRTRIFRESNSEISEYIELIRKISRETGKLLKAGASVSEFDILVRESLSKAGIEKYFTHALGHGIGFLVHAAPRISRNSNDKLAPGMIVTMEPGVYFENKFGVRHEDMYLITHEKPIILTKF